MMIGIIRNQSKDKDKDKQSQTLLDFKPPEKFIEFTNIYSKNSELQMLNHVSLSLQIYSKWHYSLPINIWNRKYNT